jgi:hypothetical protein
MHSKVVHWKLAELQGVSTDTGRYRLLDGRLGASVDIRLGDSFERASQ